MGREDQTPISTPNQIRPGQAPEGAFPLVWHGAPLSEKSSLQDPS